MIGYADTSWWISYKCADESNHHRAISIFDRVEEVEIVWTPWQRVEVLNALRQAERASVIAHGKSRAFIRSIEQEVRLGYWQHLEFSWTDAVRTACELSAEHGLKIVIRSMDLFHVAVAIESAAEWFFTFDHDQARLAKEAGLAVFDF